MIDLKRAEDRQRIVDVSNLRFYAQMFIEHKWETQWMSWTVFQQTLQEIASRIEAKGQGSITGSGVAVEDEMQPHQERVVAEKTELDDKLAKLTKFIEGAEIFKSLPETEQSRLVRQAVVMREYSSIFAGLCVFIVDHIVLEQRVTKLEKDRKNDY